MLVGGGPRTVADGGECREQAQSAAGAEVVAVFAEAKREMPAITGDVTPIRAHSPFQVPPLVGWTWCDRLPRQVVIAAVAGYLPDRFTSKVLDCPSAKGRSIL